jgi:hypothetical protein
VALVLNAMGEQFDAILNMTIAYTPGADTSFWSYMCGRIPDITVRIEKFPVPAELLNGNYGEDPVFQRRFQQWMTALWDRKEKLIDELHADMTAQAGAP